MGSRSRAGFSHERPGLGPSAAPPSHLPRADGLRPSPLATPQSDLLSTQNLLEVPADSGARARRPPAGGWGCDCDAFASSAPSPGHAPVHLARHRSALRPVTRLHDALLS